MQLIADNASAFYWGERELSNEDPITGEPGAHPMGTGLGAALGGALTGATAGTVAGPIGTVVGTIAGGVAGAVVKVGLEGTGNGRKETLGI